MHHWMLLGLLAYPCSLFAADEPKPKKGPVPIPLVDLKRITPVSFEKEILPLFAAKCQACHAGKILEGKLDMSTYASLMKGGDHGPLIVPNKATESYLFLRAGHIRGPIMPPKNDGDPFTSEELSVLKLWIEQGAKPPAVDERAVRTVTLKKPNGNVKPVRALAFNPDHTLLAASRANQVHLYDVKTSSYKSSFINPELKWPGGQPTASAHLALVESLAFSPDGKTLATGSFREVTLWDLETGTPRKTITRFADRVVALAYSPDGKTLATAGGAPTEDGEVKLFEATGDNPREIKAAHTDTVFGLAFHPNGQLLATGGADKFVKVFDVVTLKLLKTFEAHTNHVLDVGWTGDGKKLVSCGADIEKMIKVWDYEKGEKVRDMTSGKGQATRMMFQQKSPQFVLCTGDASAKLWNADTGGQQKNFDGAKDYLYAVATSRDGKLVATGGEEGIVRLYNGESGQLIKALVPPDADAKKSDAPAIKKEKHW